MLIDEDGVMYEIGRPIRGGPWDHLLIPGEPLVWRSERRLRLPGLTHRVTAQRAVWRTTVRLTTYLALVWVTLATISWWVDDPMLDCVTPPVGDGVVYRGFDNAWIWNGRIIGYTATEDTTCLSPTPI